MSIFGKKRKASGTIAKDRLKLLLISDRGELLTSDDADVKKRYDKSCGKIHTC